MATPIYMHWSFLFSGIFFAVAYRAENYEILYICGTFAVLIILHELGHALSAQYFGQKVFAIELSGVGGLCSAESPKTRRAALFYVLAGIIAQTIVFIIADIYIHFSGWPITQVGKSIAFVLIYVNVFLIIANLFPYKHRTDNMGSDGYLLWALLIQMWHRKPYGFPDSSATISPNESLLDRSEFVPYGFEVGVEIFNDNKTAMECVVDVLVKHLAISREQAIELMLTIHKAGGLLIPLETYEHAQKVASGIVGDARQKGYPLVCRPVKMRKE